MMDCLNININNYIPICMKDYLYNFLYIMLYITLLIILYIWYNYHIFIIEYPVYTYMYIVGI